MTRPHDAAPIQEAVAEIKMRDAYSALVSLMEGKIMPSFKRFRQEIAARGLAIVEAQPGMVPVMLTAEDARRILDSLRFHNAHRPGNSVTPDRHLIRIARQIERDRAGAGE